MGQIMKNTLKVERAKLNITQQDLADKVGVSRQTINSIEAERYVPSTVLAIKISDVFKINVNEIFKLDKDD
jgi:putative transcriptional regulator